LDGYRFLAAMAIVATHLGFQTASSLHGPFFRVLARCDVGVAVFFVLSGFLLHRPAARAHLQGARAPAAKPYLWRRAVRILPAYWIAVVVGMVLVSANRHRGAGTWLTNLTLTQVYGGNHLAAGMTHTWSLCAEVAYYLLLPVFWLVLRPRRRSTASSRLTRELTGTAVLAIVAWGWTWLVHGGGVFTGVGGSLWFPEHLDWFAAGMALATVSAWLQLPPGVRGDGPRFTGLQALASAPGTCWALALGIFCVALSPLAGPYDLQYPTTGQALTKEILYLGAAVVFLLPGFFGDQKQGVIRGALASAPLHNLGLISYGIFLFHRPLLEWLQPTLRIGLYSGRMLTLGAVLVPLTLVVAWLSYRLVEEPAERWRDRGPGRTQPMPRGQA
jgi:peptidoglycan/LPS O-acetylase OafA/YrhL